MALNTEKCNAWVERDKKVFAPTQHLSYYPMVIKKVDQDVIYDEDDNQYIDFLSSASSLNLGSCNPIITAAVKEQLDNYSQYTIAYTYGRKSIEYAERLTSVYPGGVPAKIVFGNCGSDANDAAVKFARAYTGRSKIITFINAYHGSTYGSISMSMVTTRMRAKMGPMLPIFTASRFMMYPMMMKPARRNVSQISKEHLQPICLRRRLRLSSLSLCRVMQGCWQGILSL